MFLFDFLFSLIIVFTILYKFLKIKNKKNKMTFCNYQWKQIQTKNNFPNQTSLTFLFELYSCIFLNSIAFNRVDSKSWQLLIEVNYPPLYIIPCLMHTCLHGFITLPLDNKMLALQYKDAEQSLWCFGILGSIRDTFYPQDLNTWTKDMNLGFLLVVQEGLSYHSNRMTCIAKQVGKWCFVLYIHILVYSISSTNTLLLVVINDETVFMQLVAVDVVVSL